MAMTMLTKNTAHSVKVVLLTALGFAIAAVTVGQPEMAVQHFGLLVSAEPRDGGWRQEIISWRAEHAVELQKPDGWLALAGLEWLEPGDNSFGSAKDNKLHLQASAPGHLGVLRLQGDSITLNAPAEGFPAGFLIDGKPVQAQNLHTDADHDKNNPHLSIGTLNMYVIHRGE